MQGRAETDREQPGAGERFCVHRVCSWAQGEISPLRAQVLVLSEELGSALCIFSRWDKDAPRLSVPGLTGMGSCDSGREMQSTGNSLSRESDREETDRDFVVGANTV